MMTKRLLTKNNGEELGLDKGLLYKLYWDDGLSSVNIGKMYDIDYGTVRTYLRIFGIPSRSMKEATKLAATKRTFKPTYWNRGLTKETDKRVARNAMAISLATKGTFVGEKSRCWKGGISFELYSEEFNRRTKEIIKQRDNYTCQLCSIYGCECLYGLRIHHIDYNKKNGSQNNLISLCNQCNSKVNWNRDYWQKYFEEKMYATQTRANCIA